MSIYFNIRGQGRPLVFFHGWGFDHQIWLPLAQRLEPFYQLILVDLPGFGQSSLSSWAQFKEALLPILPAQFAVLGWSMGGLFATRLALEEPLRVSQLINVASSPYFIRDDDWPGLDPLVFEGFMEKLVSDPGKTLAEFVGLQSDNQLTAYLDSLRPAAESLHQGLSILADWDLRQELATYKGKGAWFFGGLDSITSRRTLRVMEKIYPQFHYTLFSKAAHMPFLSHEEAFISELKAILL